MMLARSSRCAASQAAAKPAHIEDHLVGARVALVCTQHRDAAPVERGAERCALRTMAAMYVAAKGEHLGR